MSNEHQLVRVSSDIKEGCFFLVAKTQFFSKSNGFDTVVGIRFEDYKPHSARSILLHKGCMIDSPVSTQRLIDMKNILSEYNVEISNGNPFIFINGKIDYDDMAFLIMHAEQLKHR